MILDNTARLLPVFWRLAQAEVITFATTANWNHPRHERHTVMSRTFIKSILIAAVTVTGISLVSAAPAKAGNDDLAKLLFGATALIIIGKAISDSDAKAAPSRGQINKPVHKYKPRQKDRKALPGKCLRRHNTWDGRVRLMGRNCLHKNYNHVHRLPQTCRTRLHTDNGIRRGYHMRCLRNHGYYIASR